MSRTMTPVARKEQYERYIESHADQPRRGQSKPPEEPPKKDTGRQKIKRLRI